MSEKRINIYRIVRKEKGVIWDRLIAGKPDNIQDLEIKASNKKERFDYYIKQSFIEGDPYLPSFKLITSNDFGWYIKRYDRIYDRYFSKRVKIKEYLSEEIQKAYDEGMGNEFKNGKFYSVASSSRFAVSSFSTCNNNKIELLNEININGQPKKIKIELEKNLAIKDTTGKIISNPQMDVFFDCGEKYFFEVKCHEILDNHKNIELKWKYKNIISSLLKNPYNLQSLDVHSSTGNEKYISRDGKYLTAEDFGCALRTFHFDFKQFICHLLGILNDKKPNEKVHFYYLFYKNENMPETEREYLYNELKEEMNIIKDRFKKFFKEHKIDFGYFYNKNFNTLKNIYNEYEKE